MLLRRIGWHLRRVRERIDRRTAVGLVGLLGGTIVVAALIVTLVEGPVTFGKFGEAFYWALSLLLGSGDATYVSSGIGRLVSASLIILSVTLLALLTGLLIGFIIDVVIREGQGMGSAGMTGHVVVCGWNPSAREVIDELLADQSRRQVVLLCDTERNPPTGASTSSAATRPARPIWSAPASGTRLRRSSSPTSRPMPPTCALSWS